MRYAVIVLLTIYAVVQILRTFGVFEFSRQSKKVVTDIQTERKANARRKKERKRLDFYSGITNLFRGVLMTPSQYESHQYYIQRLELRSKILNRFYTPEEIRGKHVFPVICSLFCIPIGIFFKPILIVPVVCILNFVTYTATLRGAIEKEDLIIDNNFLNLYLLMYSKLRMGSRARLQNVVESYIETVKNESDVAVRTTMLKLSRFLLNNLSQYEDHVAVPKLRERYKSATIINFCNVASQALQGVDNADNLLTFKMQLIERKTLAMEKRSNRIYAQGQKSIYAIWIILFFFVCCGWYSKLPTNVVGF